MGVPARPGPAAPRGGQRAARKERGGVPGAARPLRLSRPRSLEAPPEKATLVSRRGRAADRYARSGCRRLPGRGRGSAPPTGGEPEGPQELRERGRGPEVPVTPGLEWEPAESDRSAGGRGGQSLTRALGRASAASPVCSRYRTCVCPAARGWGFFSYQTKDNQTNKNHRGRIGLLPLQMRS